VSSASDGCDLAFLYLLDWEPTCWQLTLTPTRVELMQVNLAESDATEFLLDRTQRSSVAFGAALWCENGWLCLTGALPVN